MASKLVLGSLVSAIILASITATVFSIGLGYLFQPVQAAWYDSIPGVSAVKKAGESLVDKAIDAVVPGPLKEVVKSQVGNVLPDPGKLLSDPTSALDKLTPGTGAAKNLVKDKLTDEISKLASDPARAIDPLTGNIFGDTRQVIGNIRNYADETGNRIDKSGNIIDTLGKIIGKLPSTSTVLDPGSIVSNGQIKNGFGKIIGALGSYKDEAGNTVDSSGNVINSLGKIIAKITPTGTVSTVQGGSVGQKIASMIGSRPMATLIIPNNGAQNVNPESSVFISFNKPVMRSSVTPATVNVKDGDGNLVSGNLEFRTQLSPLFRSTTPYATFAPSSKLVPGETYTVTVRGGIIDSYGNNIYPRASSFTTAGAAGQPAPGQPAPGGASTVSVLRTNPTDGMTGVATDLTIRAQFSAPIMGSTVSTNTFKLTGENNQIVPGNVLLPSGPSATIIAYDPSSPLAPGKYNVEISGVTDMQGNSVNKKWSFTTAGAAGQGPTQGQQAPTQDQPGSAAKVIATKPADRANNVPRNAFISATFNKPIDSSSLSTSTFRVVDENGTPQAGVVFAQESGPNTVVVFDPSNTLKGDERYRVQLSVGIKDKSGIPALPKQFSFQTD